MGGDLVSEKAKRRPLLSLQIAELDLLQEEVDYLAGSKRCKTCNHLECLHNDHCCPFWVVANCLCQWDKMPEWY
jgi:hypothetical protein